MENAAAPGSGVGLPTEQEGGERSGLDGAGDRTSPTGT